MSTHGCHKTTLQDPHIRFKNNKARRFRNKKFKFRAPPLAPRNTTSFIIRAKRSGGIASLVSPCPLTPVVLPTPVLSPAREGLTLIDLAKEEWGVDGYGSMKGLIRLKADTNNNICNCDESDSDVDQAQTRLDQDVNRFEMICPSYNCNFNHNYVNWDNTNDNFVLETRVDRQDGLIVHLEQENLIMKERLLFIEREMAELQRRLLRLERCGIGDGNALEGAGDICSGKSVAY